LSEVFDDIDLLSSKIIPMNSCDHHDIPFCRREKVWNQQRKEPVLGKKSAYELLMEKAMSRVKISS